MKINKSFEVIYKYLLIVFLILLLFVLSFTAYLFFQNQLTDSTLYWHKIAGVLLIVISILHIYIKKKKLKKLTKEFFHVLTNKEVSLDPNMDLLEKSLKNKTVEDLCSIFCIKIDEIELLFQNNNITYSSDKQTLNEIAKSNNVKWFFIVVKIVEYKSEN